MVAGLRELQGRVVDVVACLGPGARALRGVRPGPRRGGCAARRTAASRGGGGRRARARRRITRVVPGGAPVEFGKSHAGRDLALEADHRCGNAQAHPLARGGNGAHVLAARRRVRAVVYGVRSPVRPVLPAARIPGQHDLTGGIGRIDVDIAEQGVTGAHGHVGRGEIEEMLVKARCEARLVGQGPMKGRRVGGNPVPWVAARDLLCPRGHRVVAPDHVGGGTFPCGQGHKESKAKDKLVGTGAVTHAAHSGLFECVPDRRRRLIPLSALGSISCRRRQGRRLMPSGRPTRARPRAAPRLGDAPCVSNPGGMDNNGAAGPLRSTPPRWDLRGSPAGSGRRFLTDRRRHSRRPRRHCRPPRAPRH